MTTLAGTVERGRAGIWVFFLSEVFLFGALLAMRFQLWGNTRPDLDQQLGLLVTSILLASSFFMYLAETAIAHNRRTVFLISTLLTAVLGIAFLVGVVGFEWSGHLRPTDGVFGSVFFAMTGLHALHVASGVIIIVYIGLKGLRGSYGANNHFGVEACAIYWHFVDVVWVFFYPALYLMGTAI
ncbi:MAG: heme-copper oxidase subunit III [Acidiferrobacterales bacterium]